MVQVLPDEGVVALQHLDHEEQGAAQKRQKLSAPASVAVIPAAVGPSQSQTLSLKSLCIFQARLQSARKAQQQQLPVCCAGVAAEQQNSSLQATRAPRTFTTSQIS